MKKLLLITGKLALITGLTLCFVFLFLNIAYWGLIFLSIFIGVGAYAVVGIALILLIIIYKKILGKIINMKILIKKHKREGAIGITTFALILSLFFIYLFLIKGEMIEPLSFLWSFPFGQQIYIFLFIYQSLFWTVTLYALFTKNKQLLKMFIRKDVLEEFL